MTSFKGLIKTKTDIVLYGINPADVKRRYLAGEFSDIVLPKLKSGSKQKSAKIYSTSRSSDPNADIFSIQCKSNNGSVILTTNCDAFNNSQKVVTCWWCRSQIKSDTALGYPLDIDIDQDNIISGDTGTFCDKSCMLTYAMEEEKNPIDYWEHPWDIIKSNIYTLHYLENQDCKPLVPANHWKLLDINGGPYSKKEWSSSLYAHKRLPNLVVNPVKQTYQRQTYKN